MWISSPACFWMAATTWGWQCPVETTAMPAEKSRNSLPSTSSTITPRPRFATNGYDRVYDGERYFASPCKTRCACGPGSRVLMLGPPALMAGAVEVRFVAVMSDPPIAFRHSHRCAKKLNLRAEKIALASAKQSRGVVSRRTGWDAPPPAGNAGGIAGGSAWSPAVLRLAM